MEGKKPYLKLKGYFISNNIPLGDVAEFLGITQSAFSKKLNKGYDDFTLDQVRKLCKRYNLDANEFFLNWKFQERNERRNYEFRNFQK